MVTQQLKTIVKCAECGSTEVDIRAWVSPNDNNSFAYYCDGSTLEETETCYCRECGQWRQIKLETVPISPDDPWRCSACGSLEVESRVWADANTGENATGDDSIEYHCLNCDHDHVIPESEYLQRVEEWWSQADFPTMERITGLRQVDFSAQDGYQGFVDSASAWWMKQTTDQKIRRWQEIIYPEVEQ